MARQAQLFQRLAREVVGQLVEAVDRQPVGGPLRVALAFARSETPAFSTAKIPLLHVSVPTVAEGRGR